MWHNSGLTVMPNYQGKLALVQQVPTQQEVNLGKSKRKHTLDHLIPKFQKNASYDGFQRDHRSMQGCKKTANHLCLFQ